MVSTPGSSRRADKSRGVGRTGDVPELFEEVGLSRKDVRILASTRNWLRYKLPKRLVRWDTKPVCIGQKQKWFLLQLMSADAEINMQTSSTPEFDGWRWVSYWYPVRQVVSFKRDVYRRVMKEFASVVMALQDNPLSYKARLLIDVKEVKPRKLCSLACAK